jgi:putative transposase
MRYPLVLDLAAEGIPVAVTCRALGFSKQAFYAWKRKPVSARDWADAHLILQRHFVIMRSGAGGRDAATTR